MHPISFLNAILLFALIFSNVDKAISQAVPQSLEIRMNQIPDCSIGCPVDIELKPDFLYTANPMVTDVTLILFAPVSSYTGNEVFTLSNGLLGNNFYISPPFVYTDGYVYFGFEYIGPDIDPSQFGDGSNWINATTLTVIGGISCEEIKIVDDTANFFSDFNVKTTVSMSGIDILKPLDSPLLGCPYDYLFTLDIDCEYTVEAEDIIQSYSTILNGGDCYFYASELIELLPGFEVELGSSFLAEINEGCGKYELK